MLLFLCRTIPTDDGTFNTYKDVRQRVGAAELRIPEYHIHCSCLCSYTLNYDHYFAQ